jgi:hypothetical protein
MGALPALQLSSVPNRVDMARDVGELIAPYFLNFEPRDVPRMPAGSGLVIQPEAGQPKLPVTLTAIRMAGLLSHLLVEMEEAVEIEEAAGLDEATEPPTIRRAGIKIPETLLPEEIADALLGIVGAARARVLRINEGQLLIQTEDNGEQRIRELGEMVELREAPKDVPMPVLIPKGWDKRAGKAHTLTTENDTFGKWGWADQLDRFSQVILPPTWEEIQRRDRNMLIFPGAGGKELMRWRRRFRMPSDWNGNGAWLVENNQDIMRELKAEYRSAKRLAQKFEKKRHGLPSGSHTVLSIRDRMRRGGRFSIINIDPFNQLTEQFLESLMTLFEHVELAPNALVGMNFVGKRDDMTRRFELYEKIAGVSRGDVASPAEMRDLAVNRLLPYILGELKRKLPRTHPVHSYQIVSTSDPGNYLGEGGTPMHYSMYHVQRTK